MVHWCYVCVAHTPFRVYGASKTEPMITGRTGKCPSHCVSTSPLDTNVKLRKLTWKTSDTSAYINWNFFFLVLTPESRSRGGIPDISGLVNVKWFMMVEGVTIPRYVVTQGRGTDVLQDKKI